MRVFVTGASGWIGSAVVPELLAAGHQVVGLARSDASAAKIVAAGNAIAGNHAAGSTATGSTATGSTAAGNAAPAVEVLRGDLTDLDVLRAGAEDSDAVIHLAFVVPSVSEAATTADARAVETFSDALAGTGKPLVVSGGTLVRPGRAATERDELIPAGPVAARIANMRAALAAADRGVRSCLVMLPRSVHGEGERHGFVPQLIAMARAKGVSGYLGDGGSRWPAVHVRDAATLYRLAIESAEAGSVLHAVGDEGVPVREIAEAIGRGLGLPSESLPATEFAGMFAHLMATDMPASSTITRELLGWKPVGPGLLDDIEQGHYFH